MQEQKLKIFDRAGDRRYFTNIPNYILDTGTPQERILYIHMKRMAGEEGSCWAGVRELARRTGISFGGVGKALKGLQERGLIQFIGVKRGKTKPSREYEMVDIWALNVRHFEKKDISPAQQSPEIVHLRNNDISPAQQKKNPLNKKNQIQKALTPTGVAPTLSEIVQAKQGTDAKWSGPEMLAYIAELRSSPNKINRLIGEFLAVKGFSLTQFQNKAQLRFEIKRHARAASRLAKAFDEGRVCELMVFLREHAKFSWTLETVEKYITISNLTPESLPGNRKQPWQR